MSIEKMFETPPQGPPKVDSAQQKNQTKAEPITQTEELFLECHNRLTKDYKMILGLEDKMSTEAWRTCVRALSDQIKTNMQNFGVSKERFSTLIAPKSEQLPSSDQEHSFYEAGDGIMKREYKFGDFVTVTRSNGEVEKDWKYVQHSDENVSVLKHTDKGLLTKQIPLDEFFAQNPQ